MTITTLEFTSFASILRLPPNVIEKRPNGSPVGLQWYGQISSSNREEHKKPGADRYLDIGGDKYGVHG